MEVSGQKPAGTELIETVVSLTGLSADDQSVMQGELEQILEGAGCSRDNLTIEELRTALLGYLETLQDEIVQQDGQADGLADATELLAIDALNKRD